MPRCVGVEEDRSAARRGERPRRATRATVDRGDLHDRRRCADERLHGLGAHDAGREPAQTDPARDDLQDRALRSDVGGVHPRRDLDRNPSDRAASRENGLDRCPVPELDDQRTAPALRPRERGRSDQRRLSDTALAREELQASRARIHAHATASRSNDIPRRCADLSRRPSVGARTAGCRRGGSTRPPRAYRCAHFTSKVLSPAHALTVRSCAA